MTVEQSSQIVSIWTKRAHRGPMDRVESAELVAGAGLRGSADQGGRRQITVISEGSWDDAQEELGVEVNPSARRANVLVRGVDLEDSRGRLLRLGSCVIRIYGETQPCNVMDEAQPGLRAALKSHWRGGVCGEIVEGGTIRVGDPVVVVMSS
jgi:MOSC domain-containing protein YiiM